jgi:sterol desaturase/sphingolipid hydroxylase (fatty acid hydroxylase superfamily)
MRYQLQWVHLSLLLFFLAVGALFPRNYRSRATSETLVNLAFFWWLDFVRYYAYMLLAMYISLPMLFDISGYHAPTTRVIFDLSWIGSHPILMFVVVFLIEDFGMYWIHRAQHRIPLLWRFHATHHSAEYLDATTAARVHPIEDLYQGVIFMFLYGRTGNVYVLVTYTVLRWTIGAFEHTNIRFSVRNPLLRLWNRVLNNPHFHGWHHVNHPSAYDKNFGTFLTIWDRMFGTALDTDIAPEAFGLDETHQLDGGFLGLNLLLPRNSGPVAVRSEGLL